MAAQLKMTTVESMMTELRAAGIDLESVDPATRRAVEEVAAGIGDPEATPAEALALLSGLLTPRPPGKKQGRNERCACGSGKKYKKCCLVAPTQAKVPSTE